MRPTLSELGEYDGTALMEFKTRKQIIYRLKNQSACTYEVDDTPPFPMNREALGIALEISLLSKLNIVGEVHITRKQYLTCTIGHITHVCKCCNIFTIPVITAGWSPRVAMRILAISFSLILKYT